MAQRHGKARPKIRGLLLGSGPLARGTDRVQMLSRLLLLVIVLAAVPVSVRLGAVTGRHLAAVATQQTHTRHRTRAVLLRNAVGTRPAEPATGSITVHFTDVPASWTTPQGVVHVGSVQALAGTRAGTAVPVWVTSTGGLTTQPLDRFEVAGQATTIGIVTFVGIALAAWAGYGLICLRLARLRDRDWTVEWAAVGPLWRAQHQ